MRPLGQMKRWLKLVVDGRAHIVLHPASDPLVKGQNRETLSVGGTQVQFKDCLRRCPRLPGACNRH